jgi:hypothetical protein
MTRPAIKSDLVAVLSELHVLAGLAVTEAGMGRDPGQAMAVAAPRLGRDQEPAARARQLDRVVRGVDRGPVLGLIWRARSATHGARARVLVRTTMRRSGGRSMDAPCDWFQPLG